MPYAVDDIVIYRKDGLTIHCQCKKNEPDFNAWTVESLNGSHKNKDNGEIVKAAKLLNNNSQALAYFYSRSPFGEIAKLQEFCYAYPDDCAYKSQLTKTHTEVDSRLHAIIQSMGISTFDFLKRTKFEYTEDYGKIAEKLKARLDRLASNSESAFNALHTKCAQLWARTATDDNDYKQAKASFTAEDFKKSLIDAGAIPSPPVTEQEAHATFQRISSIGIAWRRDIKGKQLPSSTISDLEALLQKKCSTTNHTKTHEHTNSNSILLTGAPGSGKTCVLLSLKEKLEARQQTGDIALLYIQAKSFANCKNSNDLSRAGLPENLYGQVARMTDYKHVIVFIDSLDVLSNARDHTALDLILSFIDQILLTPNLSLIVSCREFDHKYETKIANRQWTHHVQVTPFDWDNDVAPLLTENSIAPTSLNQATQKLLQNPLHLALYLDVAKTDSVFDFENEQALTQKYLEVVVSKNPNLGDQAMQQLEILAYKMLEERTLRLSKNRCTVTDHRLSLLLSNQILNEVDNYIELGHQTLLDTLVIMKNERESKTIIDLINQLSHVPFVRPTIRAYVIYLLNNDRNAFRKQVRVVLFDEKTAYHLKRLILETFAESLPEDNDWPLIQKIRIVQRDLFISLFWATKRKEWFKFWARYLFPLILAEQNQNGVNICIDKSSLWVDDYPKEIISYIENLLTLPWLDLNNTVFSICRLLDNFASSAGVSAAHILKQLLPYDSEGILGSAIAKCVATENNHDDLLWEYITRELTKEDIEACAWSWGEKSSMILHCEPHAFGDKDFLKERMQHSEKLLSLALQAISQWTQWRVLGKWGHEDDKAYTSFDRIHSHGSRLFEAPHVLFGAVEAAIKWHVKNNTDWWIKQKNNIIAIGNSALLYSVIVGITEFPQKNKELIVSLLGEHHLLQSNLAYELCKLIESAFHLLDPAQQEQILTHIIAFHEEENSPSSQRKQALYILAVPNYLRSSETDRILQNYQNVHGLLSIKPDIGRASGVVRSPISTELFLSLSFQTIIRLLYLYQGVDHLKSGVDDFLGGEDSVNSALQAAAEKAPIRFLKLLRSEWGNLPHKSKDAILDGVVQSAAYLSGSYSKPNGWYTEEQFELKDLFSQILDALDRHPAYWHLHRVTANAINACAHIVTEEHDIERLLFWALGFLAKDSKQNSSMDAITQGLNSEKGRIADALMLMSNNLLEQSRVLPSVLLASLKRLANSGEGGVQAMILRRLATLQYYDACLGWELFDKCAQDTSEKIWTLAERCLYYAVNSKSDRYQPYLKHLSLCQEDDALETWARLTALATLDNQCSQEELLRKLEEKNNKGAFKGALSVWLHKGNIKKFEQQCFTAIRSLLSFKTHNEDTLINIDRLFSCKDDENKGVIAVPLDIVELYFLHVKKASFYFVDWMEKISSINIDLALGAMNLFINWLNQKEEYFYIHGDYSSILTTLFREAEERELEDNGKMLKQVIYIQDCLLKKDSNKMNEWLHFAERN